MEEYILSASDIAKKTLPIADPDPNGRYSVWVFFIITRDPSDELDLEYMEGLGNYIFEEFKLCLVPSLIAYENQSGKTITKSSTSCLLIGRSKIRKRYRTIINDLDDYCDSSFRNTCIIEIARSEVSFLRFPIPPKAKIVGSSNPEAEYKGQDICVLNEMANFRPWQKTIYNKIWNEKEQKYKEPDSREIYWIWDPAGNTGKSIFVKWMCVNRPSDIAKISFGTPNQLRSSLISAGTRKCYFIDVPRTSNGEDRIQNLLSVIEDLKNGYLVSNFYGKYNSLIMEPPHIFIFSNQKCPKSDLSQDRWRSYKINPKTLKLIKLKV